MTRVYEIVPEWYPDCGSDEDRIKLDLANAQDDPELFWENSDSDETTIELIKE